MFCIGLFVTASSAYGQASASLIRIAGAPQHGNPFATSYRLVSQQAMFTIAGGGRDKGISALIDGRVEIAQSSRQVLGGEVSALRDKHGKTFVQIPIATEVAGILVNPSNPVQNLSIFDLRQILSGSAKNWKQIGGSDAPITIYGRDDSSDSREFIEEEFMGDEGISRLPPTSTPKIPKCTSPWLAIRTPSASLPWIRL